VSTLGDRLRTAREKKGYSQTEVFKRTKINNKTLSRYEKDGSRPDYETIKMLAEIYDANVGYLVTGETNERPMSEIDKKITEAIMSLPDGGEKKEIMDFIDFKLKQREGK
jgi:transcriptional regulator with XRE-family HTH domain